MDVLIPTQLGASTFSRASTATYYNSLGLITSAAINVLRSSYNPSNLLSAPIPLIETLSVNNALSDNFLQGGDSDAIVTGATLEYNSAVGPDGKISADKLIENTASSLHFFAVGANGTETTGTGTYSIFAKAAGRSVIKMYKALSGEIWTFDLIAGTVSGTGTTTSAAITNSGNGWYRCSVTYPRGVSDNVIIVELTSAGSSTYTGNGVSGAYFWGSQAEQRNATSSYIPSNITFTSRASSASYVNSSGNIVSASTNVARQTYNPDNLSVGSRLLLEPAATNLCRQSEDFTTTWTATAATVTANTAIAPSGLTTADTVTDSSTTNNGVVAQNITIPVDTNGYVFSVFIKKTVGATSFPAVDLRIDAGGSGVVAVSVVVNTDTGVITPRAGSPLFVPIYSKVDSYGEWWRVSIGGNNNNTANLAIVRVYAAVNTDASGTWDITTTGSVTIWGAQFEARSVSGSGLNTISNLTRTSYIATTTANVTRAADVYSSSATTRAADNVGTGLYYTNIPENDFPFWSSASTYGIDVAGNNSVIYNHVKYASLQASNNNHQPDISPTWWASQGATNAYAMVDTQVGTQTIGTVGGHIICYLKTGSQSSMSFLNVVADSINVQVLVDNVVMYSTTIDFTGGASGVPITDYTLTGLTAYPNSDVRLDVYSASSAPAIGNFVVGTTYYLGSTEVSPTIGIVDYSVKTVDTFGNPTLTKRGYAKRMGTKSLVDDSQVDLVSRIMAQVRATPCVWNGNTTDNNRTSNAKTSLIVYGYYKDWEVSVEYTKSYLTATVEGLI